MHHDPPVVHAPLMKPVPVEGQWPGAHGTESVAPTGYDAPSCTHAPACVPGPAGEVVDTGTAGTVGALTSADSRSVIAVPAIWKGAVVGLTPFESVARIEYVPG